MDELPNRYYYYRIGRAVKRATRADFQNGFIQFAVCDNAFPIPVTGDVYTQVKRRIIRRTVKVVIAPSWQEAVDFIKRTNA